MVARYVALLMAGCALTLTACASKISAPAPIQRGASVNNCDGAITVRRGDTLSGIARKCGTPIESVAYNNQLIPPYSLVPGQVLNMPRPDVYTVRRGDNLYRIAMAHGMTTNELAYLNRLELPYTIYPEQTLRVKGRAVRVAQAPTQHTHSKSYASSQSEFGLPVKRFDQNPSASKKSQQQTTSQPTPQSTPQSKPQSAPQSKPKPTYTPSSSSSRNKAMDFKWPVTGNVVSRFREDDNRLDGVRIAANFGTPVRAAADGQVVYAGNEVPGYGELVLIRHSNNWVTAYALNSTLRVKKSQKVSAGEHIADVGRASTEGQPILHFEIRRGVSPVDPLQYLPAEPSAS